MSKLFAKITASALALTTTAAYLPTASLIQSFAEAEETLQVDSSLIALYAKNSLKLNEKSVSINGGIFSGEAVSYTGNAENYSVSGVEASENSGQQCELPDYVDFINSVEAYDFTYDSDTVISDSLLDLAENSVYVNGDLLISHAELRSSGKISATGDIDMSIAENDELKQAFIMSETGDITIDAADLDFTGVIYAPQGKVRINAKDIDLVGAIYADSIEINGTSLAVEYRDLFSLSCRAHTSDKITVGKNEAVILSGSVSEPEALTVYSVSASQNEYVTISDENTLTPTLIFSEAGEYDVTLTASLGNKITRDTVKVSVSDGPVVHYTSTEDFNSGNSDSVNGSNNELKLASEKNASASEPKVYSLGNESGIAVKAGQSKNSINFAGDKLDLDFELEGYGQLTTGVGNDVILTIDNSGSVWDMIPTIKESALQIIESMGPNDRLGITGLGRLYTPLTSDKEALVAAIERYGLDGSSDIGSGLRIAMEEMFDEESANRDRYIFLLADGENGVGGYDDQIALDMAAAAKEDGTKIYSFEINPFSTYFDETDVMQQVAIETRGAYKLCPDAEAISKFLLNMADNIYNLAARNVTFTTTVTNADWLGAMKKAPDSMVKNPDGSVTLSWNYNSFEIDAIDDLGISLKTGMITDNGYIQVTKDTKLISYNGNGEGSVLYIDDIIVGNDSYADSGKWVSSIFDSEKSGCPWTSVRWNADYYGNSAIDVYLSFSEDGVSFSNRAKVENGEKELPFRGRYVRTEVEMKVSDDGASPVLYDLTVYSDTVDASPLTEGASAAIKGAHDVPAESPVSLWLDINGKSDSVSDIKWDFGGGTESSSDESPLKKTVVFPEEGEYTVKAYVTSGRVTTETAVKITVSPKASLTDEPGEDNNEFKAVKMTVPEIPEYCTDYKVPLELNISFEDPEQVAWCRVLYIDTYYNRFLQAYVDEENDNLISIPLANRNLTETTIVVDAFDWYGNKTSETRKTILDYREPTLNLYCDKRWVYPNNPANFTVTAADENVLEKVALYCNDEEVKLEQGEENWTYVFKNKTPGTYEFMAEAIDIAGNRTERLYTLEVREDAGLPYAYIGNGNVILGNSIELKAISYDNETSIKELVLTMQKEDEDEVTTIFALDNSESEIEKENIYLFTPETTGTYFFTLTATDREGNVNTAQAKIICRPDINGPTINIGLSKSEILAGDFTDVTVDVKDDVAVQDVKFFINDEEAQLSEDGTFHYISDGSDVDAYGTKYVAFKVVATDTSGNERTATTRLKVIIEDTTSPNITIYVNNRFEYQNQNAYLTVNATDNIGVDSVVITANGEALTADEDGKYWLDTSQIIEYTIVGTAKDTSGNEGTTERIVVISDTTRPTVKFTADQNSYVQGDSPVISVEVTDNYELQTVTADLDGEPVETNNGSFEWTIKDAPAGQYRLNVQAEDIFGNRTETYYNVNVRDTEAPVISVQSAKAAYAKSEAPEITCEYSDNVGVTRILADIDGKSITYDMTSDSFILPETIEPGDHKVTVYAYDAAGNRSEPASAEFFVSSTDDIISPVIEEITVIPEIIRVGDEVTLGVKASDDSGTVILTVKVNDNVIEESAVAGEYVFTADAVGELKLTIKAEDESGNYIQMEGVLNVYRNTENHKLEVEAPAVVKPAENITVVISPKDEVPFDKVELWMGNTDISAMLTSLGDGKFQADFSLDATGDYTLKAVGKDNDGYETATIFTVQVSGTYETEIESEEMQEAMKQTSETELSDELKEIAAGLDSPAEIYQFVYNNVDFEAYTNSRRGAVGAYELKKGNDFDQASLLIGLLREKGYPARYAQAKVALSAEQTKSLTTIDDFQYAANFLASAGKTANLATAADGSRFVYMDEVFVQVYVPASELGETDEVLKDLGVWVNLDTSIKASEESAVEITPGETKTMSINSQRELIEASPYADIISELEAAAPQISAATGSTAIEDMFNHTVAYTQDAEYAYGRQTIQKQFTRLPSSLQYGFVEDSYIVFNEISMAQSDTVQFAIRNSYTGTNLGTYKISDIYNKRMTLQFKGNTGNGTIFEMGKQAIYNNEFLPALYLDGELVEEFSYREYSNALDDYFIDPDMEYYLLHNSSWRLGEKCTLDTAIISNGRRSQWSDEINIGSTYAMVFDTGGITEGQYYNSLYGAAENNGINMTDPANPTFDEAGENAPDGTNYYDEAKIGSYLDFAGKYYFLYCDLYNNMYSSMKDVEVGHDTKMLMTSYNIRSYESSIDGYSTTDIIPGRFQVDVSYNNSYSFSRVGDVSARNEYMFQTAYIESYYEGWLWEHLLKADGASTASIIDKAIDDGAELLYINSSNIDEALADIELKGEEEGEIRNAVASGLSVIIPNQRVTINEWSGTGYIIGDLEDYNSFVFKISGGMNGGSGTVDIDLSNCNVDFDRVFSSSFATVQSLFYYLIDFSIAYEFVPATETLAAASGCGPAAVFVGGMELYSAAKDLAEIVSYRAKMLDILFDYCMGDDNNARAEATGEMIELLIEMVKKLSEIAFPSESDSPILDGLKTLTQDLFDICAGDEADDDTKDIVHDITDAIWDAVGGDLDG